MNSKLRGYVLVVVLIAATLGGLFISAAIARQKRVSSKLKVPLAAPIYVNGNFTFSTPQALIRPAVPSVLKDQSIEPEIKVDIFGNIYVTGIRGYPDGTDLWKSTDKGTSFTYLGLPDGTQDACLLTNTCIGGLGGGDDSIDVSSGGYLYISSLLPSTVTMSVSYDGGVGGVEPGQKWEVNPASSGIPVNDRQWIAAYGPQTVYMTFDQAPVNSTIWFTKSTDAGKTWSVPTSLIPLTTLRRENNLAVDQYNGNIYTTYTPFGAPNQLNLLRSTDGGATWTNTTAYTGPAGTSVENAFPIIAVDKGGNVHIGFTRSTGTTGRTNAHVFLISSSDAGATWSAPIQIDNGPGNNSTVMPWIVAGSPGVVDVTWYGSTMSSPDSVPAIASQWWNVYFAQVTNALSASPTIAQSLVATAVHNLPICSAGGGCSGNTRDLAEYYSMTIDPDGNANIAYVDEVNYCAAHPASNCLAHTYYTKQTSGNSAYTPQPVPAPATFGSNYSLGSPGGEPGIKVDSHNCIFATAPGSPVLFRKSVNNGASFLPNVDPVADFVLCCGDEDVLSIPQDNGARPDFLYFADLAQLAAINISKSTDGGATWFLPGPGGAASEVDAATDRQWIAYDKGVPTASDWTVYEMDHDAGTEDIRFNALTVTGGSATTTGDTVWSPAASGITDPEIILPPGSTFPNTNPGPVFVDPVTHMVYGFFTGATVRTNRANPPFGKMPNVWEAVGPAPAAAGAAPGPFVNHPAFRGVQDSPSALPSPAPSPDPAAKTYGSNCANDFPSAAIDSAGNIYAVWAMNNARNNEYMVWFASSHDHGQTFYGPFQVSQGPGAAVMPWIAAGDNGRVNIVYYSTTTAVDPNIAPNTVEWNVMFAQSLNANSREPAFTISPVSHHVNHKGTICNQGLLCGSGTRTLLDFFQVAIGPDGLANVAYADNGPVPIPPPDASQNGLHTEYARQISGPLALTNPVGATCLAAPSIQPVSAVSRKTHGSAGDFDVNLPVIGSAGIEDRSGGANGNHTVIISFANNVTVGSVSVASSDGQATVSSFSVNGALVTVNLSTVANAQTLTISLTNVSDGTNLGNVSLPMAVLNGDTNADRFVDSADIAQTKSQSGHAVIDSNFREDLNVDGFIDSADIALVKSKSGTALP